MTEAQAQNGVRNGAGKKLRLAGILIVLSLLVQAFSLVWDHPLAFVTFLFVGGLLLVAGVGVYLWMLLFPGKEQIANSN